MDSVGSSGGGKSTIASLLMHFYEPDRGVVTLDGADLKELNTRWLRSQVVGVVSQDPVLLPGTVRENIAYARPGASNEEVEAWADQLLDGFADRLLGGREVALLCNVRARREGREASRGTSPRVTSSVVGSWGHVTLAACTWHAWRRTS